MTLLCIFICTHRAMKSQADSYTRGDYLLAYQIAQEIYQKQAYLHHQEILAKFAQIKDAIEGPIFEMIPFDLPKGVDSNLLKNTFCLSRLIELGSKKCYQVDKKILRDNVQRLGYIELERLSRIFYPSDNMQRFIDFFAQSQSFICQRGLVAHMHAALLRLDKLQKPISQRFRQKLLASVAIRNSINELSERDKIDGIKKFIIEFYKVPRDERSIVRTYNIKFRQSCSIYIIDPFQTLMLTYETLNRQRVNMDRYRDIVWLYDLCTHLPNSIGSLNSIGQRETKSREIYMPAGY